MHEPHRTPQRRVLGALGALGAVAVAVAGLCAEKFRAPDQP